MADNVLKLGNIRPVGADNIVVDGKYVKGGYVVVNSITERNGLKGNSGENIVKGSLCYCTANSKFYQYGDTDWDEKQFGVTTVATTGALGLVKSSETGTTADRDYAVKVNTNGTMKVNVPWTNTATAADNILDGSNTDTEITYKPYTSQQSKLSFDTSSTAPTRTDRLNLNGYLYATKLHGTWGGGNVNGGHVYLTGSNASSSTGNTTQLVFGTSTTNHVALSANDKALVINPTTGSTTNQIVLYLDQQSLFPSGISSSGAGSFSSLSENGTSLVNKYVTLATNQTITGEKLFTDELTLDSQLYANNGAEFTGDVVFHDCVDFNDNIVASGAITASGTITAPTFDGNATSATQARRVTQSALSGGYSRPLLLAGANNPAGSSYETTYYSDTYLYSRSGGSYLYVPYAFLTGLQVDSIHNNTTGGLQISGPWDNDNEQAVVKFTSGRILAYNVFDDGDDNYDSTLQLEFPEGVFLSSGPFTVTGPSISLSSSSGCTLDSTSTGWKLAGNDTLGCIYPAINNYGKIGLASYHFYQSWINNMYVNNINPVKSSSTSGGTNVGSVGSAANYFAQGAFYKLYRNSEASLSDIRLKQKINTNDLNALEIINNLNIIDFQYNEDVKTEARNKKQRLNAIKTMKELPKTKENRELRKELQKIITTPNNEKMTTIGVSAQQLQELLPKKYQKTFIEKESTNHYADQLFLKENRLIYLAFKAIQEQQEIIKSLEEKITLLEEKIEQGAN